MSQKLNLNGSFEVYKEKKKEGFFNIEAIDDDNKFWRYSHKEYGMEAVGEVEIGDNKVSFNKDNNSLGLYDSGRGLFFYKTHWIWSQFNVVLPDGRKLAVNMEGGIKQTKKSYDPSDFYVLDGKTTPLEPVEYIYDSNDFMKEWTFKTLNLDKYNTQTVSLKFKPRMDFEDSTNLFVLKSRLKQAFGTYSGFIVTKDGEKIFINDVKGLADFHYVQW